MLKLENQADLERLIDDEIQESLTLDYKASPALSKDSRSRDELCKDVSAFANSAGGQIVYGIEEHDRKPIKIDAGSELTREWVEQVVNSNVQPRIEGLVIRPIPLVAARHAYVLTIPQASGRAPHQAPDKRYYKRQNFQSAPMEDYEVKDVMHRASTPLLDVSIAFENTGSPTQARITPRSEWCDPVHLSFTVSNLSARPAEYAILTAWIDVMFSVGNTSNFLPRVERVERLGTLCQAIAVNLGLPSAPPIFREYPERAGSLSIGLHRSKFGTVSSLALGCEICTPGFRRRKRWPLRLLSDLLALEAGTDEPLRLAIFGFGRRKSGYQRRLHQISFH